MAALQSSAKADDNKPTIDPLPTHRRPNLYDIQKFQMQAAALAATFPSNLGGAAHGHISLVCRPGTQDYRNLTNNAIPYIDPMHPGAPPQHAPGTTGVAMNNAKTLYEYNLANFTIHETAKAVIKKATIDAGGPFLEALRHPLMGYNNVETPQCMAHLFSTYGIMDDALLQENEDRLDEPWDPNTEQIEVLLNRLVDVQKTAQDTDPITDQKLMRASKAAIQKTGKFADQLRVWNTRMPAHQTFQHFQDFWKDQYKAYIASPEYKLPSTTAEAGYTASAILTEQEVQQKCAYCWTHGLGFDLTHTSMTCLRKAPDHKDAATLFNMMGGLGSIRRKPGDKPLRRQPPRFNRTANKTDDSGDQK